MNEITINWHIIQKCNYTCDYCFAKYEKENKKEIHESKKDIAILLNSVYSFFSKKYKGYTLRLNIAGGEPTLSKNLSFTIQMAYQIGFKVSLITNSSKINKRFIETNAKYLFMFATSIDSLAEVTNVKIGRTSRNTTLKVSTIFKNIEQFRELNLDIRIKINTVVNNHNYKDYLGDFIDLIKPYKWKVLQALSLSEKVYCTSQEFQIFLDKHKKVDTPISKESNADMTDSYIMIDPYGRFYQNTDGKYNYSSSILNISTEEAFNSIKFDLDKFNSRYRELFDV